jgi:hypothetical protein
MATDGHYREAALVQFVEDSNDESVSRASTSQSITT